MVISLWSGPRSMSTALMYSFAQRSDTRVLDEPLYGHFLVHTGAERPCREATLAERPSTPEDVLAFMAPNPEEETGDRVLFCKHIANHTLGLPWSSFRDHRHVILFRNPAAVMASYGAHITRPLMRDLCYVHQMDLVLQMESEGNPPVVVCSDRLQAHPEPVLRALCDRLGLDWDSAILQWEAGARPEDGPWAPWWYSGVHDSTGWEARPPKTPDVPDHLQDLHAACTDAYQHLLKRAI
jgi:hypothetical protein